MHYLLHCDGQDSSQLFLIDRWRKEDPSSPSFQLLTAALAEAPLNAALVSRFKSDLFGTPEKADHAATIVASQWHCSKRDAAGVRADWAALERKAREYSFVLNLDGEDMRNLQGWSIRGAQRWGHNLEVFPDSQIGVELPAWLNRKRVYLFVYVKATGDPNGAQVGVGTDGGTWQPIVKGDVWHLETGSSTFFTCPFQLGRWNKIEFRLEPDESENKWNGRRTAAVTVNGELLLERGEFNGILSQLLVRNRGSASILAGGFSYRLNPSRSTR